jgi:hypothetical protein
MIIASGCLLYAVSQRLKIVLKFFRGVYALDGT